MTTTPPRWDLTNIYTSLDDPQLSADMAAIAEKTRQLEDTYANTLLPMAAQPPAPETLAAALSALVDALNALIIQTSTLESYLHGIITTDSFNKKAEQLMSRFEIETLPFSNLMVRLRGWFGKVAPQLPAALQTPGSAQAHAFYLLEQAERSRYLMSEPEEILANELNLSAGSAWERLQGTLTSQKTVDFELDGEVKPLPMPALINLRSHPSADVRERAYQREQQVWEEMKEPLAACLNGIKGETITLDRKRGRTDCLHAALEKARIDRQTLDAMLSAIQDSLPTFRRYFQAKARLLGHEQLPWWSLFAPVGKLEKTFSFDEARDLILANFATFSDELAGFARTAFEHRWIDAEQRPGKRGGAYCMEIAAVKESRILCNFDGSLDQVMTIAHELGHGFHNYCDFKFDKTPLQTYTPMTLAETASIMCETIVFNALLDKASSEEEELALLETSISSDGQVVVDILSRFLFEKEVFARRAKAALSPDEISQIMEQAQRDSYGDGLDPDLLNKYAWTWKPHYYSTHLSFYNFPYSFGLLFGTGLYAIYKQQGASFVPDYMRLLASTGEANAADLASQFGIDIRSKAFWAASLAEIAGRIERYCALAEK